MKTVEDIRGLFPALQQSVYGKPLVYLDNSATSQKPQCVIDLVDGMHKGANANVHRAMHKLSDDATALYEGAREKVRQFINAPGRENIIFTSGTTASINLVASSFCRKFVGEGDVVLVSGDSHHSNIVPWQLACGAAGASVKAIPVLESGELDMEAYKELLQGSRVKIVAVEHISNVMGIVNPVKEMIALAHAQGIPVLVDGAQGIVHARVDVQDMDCDFYAFSGHKIYAATGSGVLYGRRELLEAMPPYMGGGDMVDTVTFEKTTYAPLPLKYEAGTPNFIAQASLAPALEFAQSLREGEIASVVEEQERSIIEYLKVALQEIEGCRIYGLPQRGDMEPGMPGSKIPVFSFNIEGCFPSDLAQLLDKMGIAVRTGMMCCEPLMARFGVTSMVRASFLPYNTLQEAEYFIASLKRAARMLR
ncbi:MAG: SufS family cysteine desulfurase [Bacteroidales bacterium]|nr:SufS family cysteine desulfurase [Bacteroidales bacterium]